MDYARYNSATATHMPPVAGGPADLSPRDAEHLGLLLSQSVERLNAMQPGPAQAGRHQYLVAQAQQVLGNLEAGWTVPGAWMGIHRQVVELNRAIADLEASPFNEGDNRQGISTTAPMLGGLGAATAAGQQQAQRNRNLMVWSVVAVAGAVTLAFGMLDKGGRGARGVGNPHGLRVNFKNPRFPGARKAK
jgi:hypothetical protein